MKKQVFLTVAVFCLFACGSLREARADERVSDIAEYGHRFDFNRAPDFVYLKSYGFSVSADVPYMVIDYKDDYYIYRDSNWYFSEDLTGPWTLISSTVLPDTIGKHDLAEIRKERDMVSHSFNQTYSHVGSDREPQRECSTF
jgi:hypothetical protein